MAVPKAKGYRPRCFFDVTINNDKAGRIIFELFADICPKTCENFRSLCTGEAGVGKVTGKYLHFKGCPFHRVVKDFMIQGGDFTAGNGTGGESIYGGTFDDECLDLKHDRPMLLSMANRGPNTNGSQFFITTQPAPHLNGVHVIFGHVIQGIEIVQDIENQPTNEKSHPLADVRIENCGELIPKSKAKAEKLKKKRQISASDESESESESSDEEKKRKKERKRKKEKQTKKEKRKGKMGSDDDDDETRSEKEKRESKEEPAPFSGNPLYMQSVEIDAIPDVPTSSFLMRRSRTPSPVRQKRKEQMKRSGKSPPGYRAPPQSASSSKPRISSSGRILRGRGQMRYRTPPPDSQRESSNRRWSRSRSRSRSPQRRRRSRSPRRPYQDSRRPTRRGRSRSRSRSPATRRNSSPGRRNGRRSSSPSPRDRSRDVPHAQDRIRDGSKWERNPSPTRDSVRRERDFRGNADRDHSARQEEDRRSAGTEPLSHEQVPQFINSSEDPNQFVSRITNKSRWERHQSSDEEASRQTKPEAIAGKARDNSDGAKKDTDYGNNLFSSVKEQILENEAADQRNVSEINAKKRNVSSSSPESGKKSRRTRRRRSRSSSESSPESKRKVSKRKSRSRSSSERRRNRSRKRPSSDSDTKSYKSRSRERKSRSRERKSRSHEPRKSSGGRTKSCDKESSSRDRKNRSRSRDRSRKNRSREKERRSPSRSRGRRQSRSRSRGKREKSRSRSRDRRRKSSSRGRSGRRHRSRSTSKQRSSGWSKRKPRDSSSSRSD